MKVDPKRRRISAEEALELWTRVPGDRRRPAPRPADHDLRAARQVHRLPQDPRAAGALRGRGLHLVRARGADRLDRPLRPGEGRDARAVRVDPHPRRRARRAAPPGLGAALAAPLGARHQQARASSSPPCTAAVPSEDELADALATTVEDLRTREHEIQASEVTSLNTLVISEDDTTIERLDTLVSQDIGARSRARDRQERGQGQVPPRLRAAAAARARAGRPALREEHDPARGRRDPRGLRVARLPDPLAAQAPSARAARVGDGAVLRSRLSGRRFAPRNGASAPAERAFGPAECTSAVPLGMRAPLRRLPRPLELVGVEDRREVDEGSGDGGYRNAVDLGDLAWAQASGLVKGETRDAAAAASRTGDVNTPPLREAVDWSILCTHTVRKVDRAEIAPPCPGAWSIWCTNSVQKVDQRRAAARRVRPARGLARGRRPAGLLAPASRLPASGRLRTRRRAPALVRASRRCRRLRRAGLRGDAGAVADLDGDAGPVDARRRPWSRRRRRGGGRWSATPGRSGRPCAISHGATPLRSPSDSGARAGRRGACARPARPDRRAPRATAARRRPSAARAAAGRAPRGRPTRTRRRSRRPCARPSGSRSASATAAPACTAITVTLWPTTSCSSRATCIRSAATAAATAARRRSASRARTRSSSPACRTRRRTAKPTSADAVSDTRVEDVRVGRVVDPLEEDRVQTPAEHDHPAEQRRGDRARVGADHEHREVEVEVLRDRRACPGRRAPGGRAAAAVTARDGDERHPRAPEQERQRGDSAPPSRAGIGQLVLPVRMRPRSAPSTHQQHDGHERRADPHAGVERDPDPSRERQVPAAATPGRPVRDDGRSGSVTISSGRHGRGGRTDPLSCAVSSSRARSTLPRARHHHPDPRAAKRRHDRVVAGSDSRVPDRARARAAARRRRRRSGARASPARAAAPGSLPVDRQSHPVREPRVERRQVPSAEPSRSSAPSCVSGTAGVIVAEHRQRRPQPVHRRAGRVLDRPHRRAPRRPSTRPRAPRAPRRRAREIASMWVLRWRGSRARASSARRPGVRPPVDAISSSRAARGRPRARPPGRAARCPAANAPTIPASGKT